jgi:hypothetical protein
MLQISKFDLIIFSGWTYSAGHINAEMISKALFPPSPQNLVTGFTFARVFYPKPKIWYK